MSETSPPAGRRPTPRGRSGRVADEFLDVTVAGRCRAVGPASFAAIEGVAIELRTAGRRIDGVPLRPTKRHEVRNHLDLEQFPIGVVIHPAPAKSQILDEPMKDAGNPRSGILVKFATVGVDDVHAGAVETADGKLPAVAEPRRATA